MPLLREGEPIGSILLARQRVEPFTDRQIELVSTFADQAVIAIENTRLITEQREALEQQTATAEVLQVINASPGNLTPVFDAMLEKAMRLCEAAFGCLYTYDGERFQPAATWRAGRIRRVRERTRRTVPATPRAVLETAPRSSRSGSRWPRIIPRSAIPSRVRWSNSAVHAPILYGATCKDDTLLGYISIYRQEVRAFSDKQIALLENFAAQAVIAMENARLID